MSDSFPDIKSVVVRVITNKPVRKTPYQVKGVFMRQFSKEPIIPFLDGSYRNRFLYPRVQVKILNEQIYLVGINEGVDPIINICKNLTALNFGNITFEVQDCEIDNISEQFIPCDSFVCYSFITPWIALNHMTNGKYQSLTNEEKPSYLNKLIGQNIIFLASEVGINLKQEILVKLKPLSLTPDPVDEHRWGAFSGAFKTNFSLPSFIGIGNGITRGFGTIYKGFGYKVAKNGDGEDLNENPFENIDGMNDVDRISITDVPIPKKKRFKRRNKKQLKTRNKKFAKKKKNKNYENTTRNKSQNRNSGPKYHNLENDNKKIEKDVDYNDDQRFNTEKHHKQQHKF